MIRVLWAFLFLSACSNNGNAKHAQVPGVDIDKWYCVSLVHPNGAEKNYPCYETPNLCTETRYRAMGNGGKAGECEQHTSAYCLHATDEVKGVTRRQCHLVEQYCLESRERGLAKGYEMSACGRVPP